MQGNVVIPGHHDLRFRQAIEKGARFRELMGTSTLRQISRDSHQIGIDLCDRINQGRDDVSIDATKMYV
jgi:hypothetical protein